MSFKRILSLVLVLCMVLSFFPASAFADEVNDVVEEEVVEEVVEEPAAEEQPEENNENPPEAAPEEGAGETEEPASSEEEAAAPVVEEAVEEEEEEEEVVEEEVVAEAQTVSEEAMDATTHVAEIQSIDGRTRYYETLAEAILAAGEVDPVFDVMMKSEISLRESVEEDPITINKAITLNGEGKTIASPVTISGGDVELDNVTLVKALTINGGNVTLKRIEMNASLLPAIQVSNDAVLTIPATDGGHYGVVRSSVSGHVQGGIFDSVSSILLDDGYVPSTYVSGALGETVNGTIKKTDYEAMIGTGVSRQYGAFATFADADPTGATLIVPLKDTAPYTLANGRSVRVADTGTTGPKANITTAVTDALLKDDTSVEGAVIYTAVDMVAYVGDKNVQENRFAKFAKAAEKAIDSGSAVRMVNAPDADDCYTLSSADHETLRVVKNNIDTDANVLADGSYTVVTSAPDEYGATTYSIGVLAAASIGTKTYPTLAAAVAAVQPNETITLLRDVEIQDQINLPSDVTLDGDNYTISVGGYFKPGLGDGGAKALLYVGSNVSNVTIQNVTLTSYSNEWQQNVVTSHLISVVGSATIRDVVFKQYSTRARGADALQTNGTAIVDGTLTFYLGEKIWSPISLNKDSPVNEVIFTENAEIVIADDQRIKPQATIRTHSFTTCIVEGAENIGYVSVYGKTKGTYDEWTGFEPETSEKLCSIDPDGTIHEGTLYNYKVGDEFFKTFAGAAAAAKATDPAGTVEVFKTPATGDVYKLTEGTLLVKLHELAEATDIVTTEGAFKVVASEPVDGVTTCSLEPVYVNLSHMDGNVAVVDGWYDSVDAALADCGEGQFIVVKAAASYVFAANKTRVFYLKEESPNLFTYTFPHGYEVTTRPDSGNSGSTRYELTATTYNITYAGIEDVTVSPEPTTYTADYTGRIRSPEKDLYQFNGWTISAATVGEPINFDLEKESEEDLFPTVIPTGNYGNVILTANWLGNPHTITIRGNGGTIPVEGGDDQTEIVLNMNYNDPIDLSAYEDSFRKTGYHFKSWFNYTYNSGYIPSTMPDANLTIDVVWEADTFTIAFDKGTGDSGTTASVTATYDTEATLTNNGFKKVGHNFKNWYIVDGETTLTYNNKAVLTADQVNALYALKDSEGSTILTADWGAATYKVSFNRNPAIESQSMASVSVTYGGGAVELPLNTFIYPGYTFSKWNTKADGTGVDYEDGAVVENLTAAMTLYAQWTPDIFTIAFDGNGNDGGETAAMTDVSYKETDPVRQLNQNGFTRTGYTFAHWTLTQEDSTTAYWTDEGNLKDAVLQNFYSNALDVEGTLTATLYAQWSPITYQVAFDANGGSGRLTTQKMTYDVAAALTQNRFTRTGYNFAGWNTMADGSGTSYTDKQSVSNLSSKAGSTVTLYAQWTHEAALYDGSHVATPYATVADAKAAYDAAEQAEPGKYRGVTIEKDGVSYALAFGDTIKVIKNGHTDFKVEPVEPTDKDYYIIESDPEYGVVTYTTALCVASVTTVPYEQKYVDFELKWVPKDSAYWTTVTYNTFADAAAAALDREGLEEHDQKYITLLDKNTVKYELGEGKQLLINANGYNPNLTSYAVDQKIVTTSFDDIPEVKLYSYEQLYFVRFLSDDLEELYPTQSVLTGRKAKEPTDLGPLQKKGYHINPGEPVWYTKNEAGEYEAYDFTKPVTEDADLYAKLTPNTYTFVFKATPTDVTGEMAPQVFTYDVKQNLTENAYTLEGRHFTGWAYTATGEAMIADKAPILNYTDVDGQSYNVYTTWDNNNYTVTFHANNGIDPEATATQNLRYISDPAEQNPSLDANTFTTYGYTFVQWNTKPDGTGDSYKNKAKVNFVTENEGNVDLYAQWKEASFKLAFNGNGAAGTAMTAQTVTYNKDATLNANTYTRAGYDFQGWALSDSAEKAEFADQAELTVLQINELFEYGQGKTVTLYAVWSPINYVFEYEGVEDDYEGPVGYNLETIPEEGLPVPDPVKTGSTFTGWTLVITDDEGKETVLHDVKGDVVPAVKPRLGNRVYTANWEEINYTLTFNAKGGKVVNPETQKAVSSYTVEDVHYGDAVVWPEDPTRAGYSFAEWVGYTTDAGGEKIPVEVPFDKMPAESVTVEATWTVNQYTLTFYDTNPDGTPIETPLAVITQDYNTAVTAPKDPTKTHYLFDKWVDKDGKPVTVPTKMPAENRDYYATWLGDLVTIIWHDDNELLWNNTNQRYGQETVPAESEHPEILTRTKPGFALDPDDLWDPSVSEYVEGNAFYNLNWKPVYTVEFILDGRTISKIPVTKGFTIPADKEPTAEEGGKQAKWLINGEIDNFFEFDETVVNGDMRLVASWTAPITFLDGDGNELLTKVYPYDEKPDYNGPTPTKEPTEQYSYTWTGEWDPAIVEVSGSATYTATFEETVNKYTITWKDGNGDVLKTDTLAYDAMPKYTGDTPTKEATAQYSYAWTGEWDPEVEEVKGDATYTATFTETVNKYTITWKDGNDEVLKTDTLAYGVMPEYTGDTPTKDATAQYTYTFNGKWLPEFAAVSEDATYTAQFDETVNKYKVTFMDGEKKYFEKDVDYGSTVEQPKDPTTTLVGVKFAHWSEQGHTDEFDFSTPITKDTVLEAVWEAIVPEEYTVTFDADGGEPEPDVQTVKEGEKAEKPATDPVKVGADFIGWFEEGSETAFDFENTPITGDLTLTAKYKPVVEKLTVTFIIDGEVYNTAEVEYNKTVAMPDIPAKENEVFIGWFDGETEFDPSTPITANLELTGKYENAFTYSLDLLSKIGIRVNMMIPKDADPAEYSVRVQYSSKYQNVDKTIAFTDSSEIFYNAATGRYTFYPVDVGSDEMVDVATLTILKNGEAVASKGLSVRDIAVERLKTETDPDIVTLHKALMQYGHYAQLQFGTHVDDLPPAGEPALDDIGDQYAPSADPAGVEQYFKATKFSLGLDEEVVINATLTPADGYTPEDFNVSVRKGSVEVPVTVEVYGGVMYFTISGIYSDQMFDDYDITVSVKNTATSFTWTRSIINCAYNNQQQGKAVDLMQALYQYALAATAVFS